MIYSARHNRVPTVPSSQIPSIRQHTNTHTTPIADTHYYDTTHRDQTCCLVTDTSHLPRAHFSIDKFMIISTVFTRSRAIFCPSTPTFLQYSIPSGSCFMSSLHDQPVMY
ncbi:hypothetical protein NP493_872g00007 [Ridgeia piscesae]|uniref:Uncharacterized protein n=1 Tax=Ridgeia piscesae TaxID=27915 RepID=A0AAD9KLS6_RIDPI|nr:hypothetical protein NP493_872g00007 [Ridgeia piscesae]